MRLRMPKLPEHTKKASVRKADFMRVARECEFELGSLARRFDVSTRTLQRFIRRSYDRPAEEWLKEQRLNQSLHYLAESRSVKRASEFAGFKQHAHFTREFKRTFRITPSAYLALRKKWDLAPSE